jgi:hypothetical protein
MTLRCRPLTCVFIVLALLSVAETQALRDHTGTVSSPTSREQLRLREKWFRKGRVVPGRATAAMLYSAQQRKLRQRAKKQTQFQLGTQTFAETDDAAKPWLPLGPAPLASNATGPLGEQDYGPVVGRATAVVVDPGDPTGNLVYVGGAYGGLWKSTNAAASNAADVTWTPLLDDQPTLAVGAIALKPTTGVTASVILVGTGEANNAPDSYYGLGILRSIDAGAHWTLISSANGGARPFRGLAFSKIAFSTANPNLVVAAVAASNMGVSEDAENPQGVNRGLYYSSDAGATWNYATVQDSGQTISPSSVTSVVYAPTSGLFYAAVRYHGIYISATGSTWQRLNHQPGTGLTLSNCPTATSSNCPFYRAEIATVDSRNEVYAWYVDANDVDQGIYQTKDNGEHWTQISDSGILNCGDGPNGGCGTEQGSYNLALTAIANGSATDLWAGAINLYKCTISSINQHCDAIPFKNLTHVYGCNPAGSLSHVHPNQHAMAFLPVSPNVVLYFVNDGGVYRTLNAYDPNFSGDCGGSNPFQNLNGAMGSLMQFISFAQDPGDRTTFLGGAQANGSPATNSLHGTSWISVNGGDGGFSEINPNSMDDWFTANSFVSVQRCALGIDCLAQDFSTVVNSGTVGGDSSAFYMPYMLDPQASTRLIVGTCRVWRGNSNGTSFSAVSFNFDDDTSSTCTGEELNLIRSLAAGGPTSGNGSKVIYAGTEAGRVFVTTDADSGAPAWADRTGSINPGNFPISSIAIDPTDATGRTAFVAIMGFGVSHVFRTQDAGGHWMDASGSEDSLLPDAPANSLLVDPSDPLTVYVGTDVGVFVTHDAGTNWLEMGPTSGAGMLPNSPVTRLRMFDEAGTVRLRASTYGRGLWETVLVAKPDFSLSMDGSELTLFVNQAGAFTGFLTALDGYAATVNLTCSGDTLPATCIPDPAAVTPTSDGAAFSVQVGGTPADYSFNIRAAGTDTDHITHTKPVTLHMIDFGLSAPSPNAVDVNQGSTSGQISFQLTAQGSFNANVTLSCTAIAGLTCNFSPSTTVSPTAGNPVTIHLTISAAVNTQLGTSTLTIQASTPGAPAVKTQLVTVTVKNLPDYSLSTPSLQLFSMAGQQVTFPVSLTPVNGYRGPVNVTCDASTLGANCGITPSGPVSLDPGHLVNGSAVVNAAFTVPGLASTQVITITIYTSDATDGSPAHSLQITLTIGEFRILVPSISQTIHAGETAHFELDYAPPNQTLTGNVTFSCGALPALSRCSFAPNPIAANAPATVILSISTTAPVAALAPATFKSSILYACFYLLPLGAVLHTEQRRVVSQKRRVAQEVLFVLVVCALILFVQCGGGNGGGGGAPYVAPAQSGTPVGTYSVNVTAQSGTATRRVTLTLTVQ